MNEAELEARLNGAISNVFPTIEHARITHQKSFTIRFGHHSISINGKERYWAGGRSDVLLRIDDVPRILFELKRPGDPLTDDDRDQGISYARLLDPMPPLTVISNGEEARLFRTFDRQEFIAKTATEEDLIRLIRFSLNSASQERSDAVKVLLTGQSDLWAEVVRRETEVNLAARRRDATDFTAPLCREFSFPRVATNRLLKLLSQNNPIVAVTGQPLTGKTNVLAQLCRLGTPSGKFVFLYADSSANKQGVFRLLANQFARGLSAPTSPEDLRRWLARGRPEDERRMVVVLDGWSQESAGTMREDLDELFLMANAGNLQVVLTLDTAVFAALSKMPGRNTATAIGAAPRIEVLDYSHTEFRYIRRRLFQKNRIDFLSGSEHSRAYRSPSLLRACVATKKQLQEDELAILPSVVGVEMLRRVESLLAPLPELEDDLQRFAEAIALDASEEVDAIVGLAVHRSGKVRLRTAETVLGQDRITRLRQQGYCTIVPGPRWSALAAVSSPEMVATAGAHWAAQRIVRLSADGKTEDAYRLLSRGTSAMPYGEIVGAYAVIIAARWGVDIKPFVSRLVKDSPSIQRIGEGSVLSLHIPSRGEVRIHLGEGAEEELVANAHPWLVLSHLGMSQIAEGESWAKLRFAILAIVGSFNRVLRHPDDFALGEMLGVHEHEIPGVGHVVCWSSGIIEAATEALRKAFVDSPEQFSLLIKQAVEKQDFALAWRIQTVLSTFDPESEAIQIATQSLNTVIGDAIQQIAEQHGH